MIYDESLYNSAYAAVTNLDDTASAIKITVADARKVVDQVNAGQGTIGKLLHDEALYQRNHRFDVHAQGDPPKINQGQGTIGKVVNDQELYRNAKLTLQKLDQATEGLEDQGP
jgi:phospholipid/cholesterol/gamma-HCH transport system substrate-binding protein